MERAIITISENGKVNIPCDNVWMYEMELVELFGVIAPTLRAAIKAIYKSGILCSVTTHRRNISNNLQIHTTAGLIIYAIANKLINIEDMQN